MRLKDGETLEEFKTRRKTNQIAKLQAEEAMLENRLESKQTYYARIQTLDRLEQIEIELFVLNN